MGSCSPTPVPMYSLYYPLDPPGTLPGGWQKAYPIEDKKHAQRVNGSAQHRRARRLQDQQSRMLVEGHGPLLRGSLSLMQELQE